MKTTMLIGLTIGLLAFSCETDEVSNSECISGKIVGQKCDVYALQLDQKILGAGEWSSKDAVTAGAEATYSNVIGLINLPQVYRREGIFLFVTLREPTAEERNVPCYTGMPNPPSPYYVVLSASESNCDDNRQ